MLGRGSRSDNGQESEPEQPANIVEEQEVMEEQVGGSLQSDESVSERGSDSVRDQLERLAGQVRGLQQQVEEFVARRNDAVAGQASQRVEAIVQAAEQSAAEITAEAHREAAELRERVNAEAQADADRIRVEAQGDASKIRTEAHASAAALREQTLAEVRREVERVTEQLADELRNFAAAAFDEVAGGASPAPPPPYEPAFHPETPEPEVDELLDAEVEDAVDELQSAAAVLEQSLRHLQEIGQASSEEQ